MPKDKLVIETDGYWYYLQWYLAEDRDLGGVIGESTSLRSLVLIEKAMQKQLAPDEQEACVVHRTALQCGAQVVTVGRGIGTVFAWETLAGARTALAAIKAGLLADASKRPWPDWAIKAKAAGWKPPKGWKP